MKDRLVRKVGREVRAAAKLTPGLLLALLLGAVWWHGELAATDGLFQSPADTPTATMELASPTPTVEVPAATATEEVAPTPSATMAQILPPTRVPSETPSPTAEPTDTKEPVAVPTEVRTATPRALEAVTATASPTGVEGGAETPIDDRERYAQGESDLLFDWGMLVDSVALGASYIWLCCGIIVLLSVPLLFLVLWVASKRRQQRQD